ncbi:MAG: hypothetical protein WAX14_23155 [Rhodococcus sp. (in: high G+C Gram-positive bacteria)]|uniref:hypothetical protein n=1 Tax=Rhodococcus sp. TaxID=1831 RepID=UPI003BB786E2
MSVESAPYHHPIAVVDEQPTTVAVWHVDISGELPPRMSRLGGAWVLDTTATDTVATLLTGRYVVRCTPAPADSVVEQLPVAGWIDLDATVDAVHTEIRDLDKRFTEHAATVKSKLTRPDWPEVPDPRTAVLRPVTGPGDPQPDGAVALDLARGIRDLADVWTQVETQRAMRTFLVEPDGKAARPLPLVTR